MEKESWFRLGGLEYFNSSIWSGTEATNVQLDLSIAFTTPDVMETFNFSFALENTPNRRRRMQTTSGLVTRAVRSQRLSMETSMSFSSNSVTLEAMALPLSTNFMCTKAPKRLQTSGATSSQPTIKTSPPCSTVHDWSRFEISLRKTRIPRQSLWSGHHLKR